VVRGKPPNIALAKEGFHRTLRRRVLANRDNPELSLISMGLFQLL
jgi:hypothetical protein